MQIGAGLVANQDILNIIGGNRGLKVSAQCAMWSYFMCQFSIH